jgi:hypothetical protein
MGISRCFAADNLTEKARLEKMRAVLSLAA